MNPPTELRDFDWCVCGHYRYEHRDNGEGACLFRGLTAHRGNGNCWKFEMNLPALGDDPEVLRFLARGGRVL